jgi:ligand-binding SRPBCC domain-containing protein
VRTHEFVAELWQPQPRTSVFSFFADARNLEVVTPPWVNFEIRTPTPLAMRVGALIDYRLRVHGVPVRWQSEITVWDPPCCFVDEQRHGPYRQWVHTHEFEERYGGTLCRDRVVYAVPGGPLINWLLVRREVERIFAYRKVAPQRQLSRGPRPASLPVPGFAC